MDRRKFIGIASETTIAVGTIAYLLSDKSNLSRADIKPTDDNSATLKPDEKEILFLASLAPIGHNTQPWFVQYLKPYHWIIGNDKSKWLPAVDPTQRETILALLNPDMNCQILPHPSPLPEGEGTRFLAPFSPGRRVGEGFAPLREEGNSYLHSATPIFEGLRLLS